MDRVPAATEPATRRQVFRHWSILLPAGFQETFVREDGYWHARGDDRSVSLTSALITDRKGRPVPARQLLGRFPPLPGVPVPMPHGMDGSAAIGAAEQPACAERALCGMIAVEGNVLIATITAEDLDWAVSIWLSIRHG
jgi:hypothetical protein